MSRTLGIILMVAAIAFAIAVPVFGVAALGITAGIASAISAGLAAAIMVNNMLMPKGSTAADLKNRQASATTLQLGETPRCAIFGKAAVAGSLVDAFNWGGDYGTDWEAVIFALADHKCEGLDGFYVNDTFVAFTGDGVVTGYNGQLEVYFRSGDLVQTLPSVVTTNGPGWTSSDYGAGVTYAVVAYKADAPDASSPTWPGGRPRFLWVLKGKRCYDPRKDSTAGGSGAHRWASPATWEWSENAIVCRYNWARGVYAGDQVASPGALLVGRGLSAVEQPPANLFAPANICDETVDGVAQFKVGGLIYSNERFLDVESRFASAVAGVILTHEGAVEIEPAQAKAVVATFTDDDLLVGSEAQWNEGILSDSDSDWVNTVVPRYVEPTQKWADHGAPVRRDLTDVANDGGPREMTIGMDLVTNATQAGVTGEIHRRLGRLWGRGGVALPPRFAAVEEGDWVAWQSARRFGGATKVFRSEAFAMDEKWQSRHQLREIATSVFTSVPGLVDHSNPHTPTPSPTLTAPPTTDWTLTGGEVAGSGGMIPALLLAGAVTPIAAESVLFDYRPYVVGAGVDDNWIAAGEEARSIQNKSIVGVAPGAQYEVSIRYKVQGLYTPRLIKGPVTTAGLSAVTQLINSSYTYGLTFSIADTGTMTISNHSRAYPDKTVSVTGTGGTPHAVSGAVAGDKVFIFYDDPNRAGGAVSYQHLRLAGGTGDTSSAYPSTSHPYRHFLCAGVVPATGGTTSGGSDSGAGAGGGSYCVEVDSAILLAAAGSKRAGNIQVGDVVRTMHETTLEWGDFPVSAVSFATDQDLYLVQVGSQVLRATAAHLLWLDGAWVRADVMGRPDGKGTVALITVDDAHTYVANGLISHNIKPVDGGI